MINDDRWDTFQIKIMVGKMNVGLKLASKYLLKAKHGQSGFLSVASKQQRTLKVHLEPLPQNV